MRLLKWLLKIFVILVAILGLLIAVLTIYSFQDTSVVDENIELRSQDVVRIKNLLTRNSPYQYMPGERRVSVLPVRDVNLVSMYLLDHLHGLASSSIRLDTSVAHISFSYRLTDNPFGEYFNISTSIKDRHNHYQMGTVAIGDIDLPAWAANFLMRFIFQQIIRHDADYRRMVAAIEGVTFEPGQLVIAYRWDPVIMTQLRKRGSRIVMTESERERFLAYANQLQTVIADAGSRKVSLMHLLKPMFEFAKKRSKKYRHPVEENRALLIVLGAYMLDKDLAVEFGEPALKLNRKVVYRLEGRQDLAKHYLISAALAAMAGEKNAKLVSLHKELDDVSRDNRFSFIDMMTNEAGITMARIALNSEHHALLLQQRMMAVNHESEFMPNIENLPDSIKNIKIKSLNDEDFEGQHQQLMQEIRRRISSCRVYY